MNIVWNENPLATVIELDESDKAVLALKLRVEDLEERIFMASHCLGESDKPLEKRASSALKELDVSYVLEDEKRDGLLFSERVNERLVSFVEELAGVHCGDCTCVASSCLKCHAEELLGVHTTRGLGKHPGAYVRGAFAPRDGGMVPTITEAIEHLRDYRPTKGKGWEKYSDEDFQRYVPGWIEDAKRAHTWLASYQQEHFKALDCVPPAKPSTHDRSERETP